MRGKSVLCCAILLSSAVFGWAGDNGSGSTYTGVISDSICARAGSHEEAMHMSKDMGHTAAECTIACVEHQGAKYVLYDAANKKIYRLSNQELPKKFAGQAVKVTGTLKKNEIVVQSITAQ
jgi:L-lactate utilization protein LutB